MCGGPVKAVNFQALLERRHEFEEQHCAFGWLVGARQSRPRESTITVNRQIQGYYASLRKVISCNMSASSKRCHVGPVRAVNFHALLEQRRDFKIYRAFRQLVRGSPVRGRVLSRSTDQIQMYRSSLCKFISCTILASSNSCQKAQYFQIRALVQ